MRVAFFEDSSALNFHPIALARPVFELVCGRHSIRERIVRHLPVTDWGVFCREHLAETYRETHPEAHVNDFAWLSAAPTLVINGRWIPTADAVARDLEFNGAGLNGGRVAFFALEPFDAAMVMRNGWDEALSTLAQSRGRIDAPGLVAENPWDLVRHNPTQLLEDFRLAGPPAVEYTTRPNVAVVGSPDSLFIDATARIEPFVVFDTTTGPIAIGPGALVRSFSHIEGPCHVDCGSQLWAAAVRGGSTIGPDCRVGGEVECSILHGHVNKYHTGFLGHSYLCPWVNLGAQTTTSDLKNDYTHVRVPVMGDSIDTGMTKVGSFMADHTKTAIGTLLNTGSSIGAMSMLLPDGKLSPKHVPSFCKLRDGELTDDIDLERALRTARIAMGRRNCELTAAQERLWRRLYVQTRGEREDAITRLRERELSREMRFPH
jgi:UDP-N-acetylglucosamine diphosphorylase / glucose-1-phosphate thymidylyltransferase / UDP-N-acetylgalactosamine diphosphorylase / glucosamine-1-phosphate N-acetyltransferase / galactosamine-1-phosphate N-acetyltransferase